MPRTRGGWDEEDASASIKSKPRKRSPKSGKNSRSKYRGGSPEEEYPELAVLEENLNKGVDDEV